MKRPCLNARPLRRGALALLTMLVGVAPSVRSQSVQPDTIYFNGLIYTMAPQSSTTSETAQAIAVYRGRIVAVGTNDSVRSLAGPRTRTSDLEGRAVLPGLYAAHDHFPGSGRVALFSVDLNSPPIGSIESIDELVKALKDKASSTPEGEWIQGRGYDDTLLSENRHPTRHDLDRVSTRHPIFITHISGHLSVSNSLALERAGIDAHTPQPSGGVIRMGDDAAPNGVIEESSSLVSRLIPSLTEKERMDAIRWAVTDYTEEGVTTTVIAGGRRGSFLDLQRARRLDLLKLRVIMMGSKGSAEQLSPGEAGGFLTGFGDHRLKVGAIKLVQDGSIQGYTGYLSEPYEVPFMGDGSYRGYARRSREELDEMVLALHRAGYQIAIHGNGDAAIDDILQAFEKAHDAFPRPDARHRIEHCQMVREDQLDRIKTLGISPSFFVGHAYYWGDRHRDIFMGPERAARLSPLKSALERGIRFTVHDDTPVTPVRPLQLVWDAVNRQTTSGKTLGPAQRIGVYDALKAVTLDAAWQNHEEQHKGSIEPDKLADFIVVSASPFEVDPLEIRDITVLQTVVGGERVFQR